MSLEDVKKNIKGDKFVIGTNRTVKLLKEGKLARIFISSNCPQAVREEVERYGSMQECPIDTLAIPNDELGVICKKPFAVSVAALLK